MELVSSVTSIEIPTDKISYDKKSNVFSAEVLNFMFVGIYKKSTRINKILDDIFASLGEIQLTRNELCFIDPVLGNKIPETTKLKHLKIAKKYKLEKEKKTVADKRKSMKRMEEERYKIEEEADEMEKEAIDEDKTSFSLIADDAEYGEEKYKEEPKEDMLYSTDEEREITRDKEAVKAKKKPSSMPRPSPAAGPPAPRSAMAPPPPPVEELRAPPAPGAAPTSSEPIKSISEESKPIVYNINMGLQYYSVMMEKRSYLFYVYFSHKELKIVDEEGKTIYETTITIVTKKEEPPVLDLKIEGEGFEVHPIFGKVEVKKHAVNPPVMIFSIMPIKSKMKKRESERRFLNVYVEFEEKVISHTILSIIVQPKYFRLDIGPIHLNLSKRAAAIISFISILVAGASLIYMLFSIDPSSTFIDMISGFAPGLGSIVFFVIFIYTLFKEGIYPLKEKISAFLNFDQAGVLIK